MLVDGLLEDTDVEDDRKHPRLSVALKFISLWCFTLCLWFILSLFFLPLFISSLIVWGSPPIAPSLSAFCKVVAVFTEGNAKENIPFTNRVLVFFTTCLRHQSKEYAGTWTRSCILHTTRLALKPCVHDYSTLYWLHTVM